MVQKGWTDCSFRFRLYTLEKKFPKTSAFSVSVLTVIGLPSASVLFRSRMLVLILRLLLMYFQKTFGFCLHCPATLRCSSFL